MRAFFFTLFMAGLCLWMPLTASAAAPAATEIISIEEYEAAIQREAAQYGIRCYVIRYDPAVQITREQLAFTLEEMRMAGGFTVQEARPGQSWVTIRAGRDLIAHSIRYAAFLSRHPSTVMRPVPALPAGSVSQGDRQGPRPKGSGPCCFLSDVRTLVFDQIEIPAVGGEAGIVQYSGVSSMTSRSLFMAITTTPLWVASMPVSSRCLKKA